MNAPAACLSCRKREAHTRGVCVSCYRRLVKQVSSGKTTWTALEAAGLLAPVKPRPAGGRKGQGDHGDTPKDAAP